MADPKLNIVQVNSVDLGGGAAKVAWNLFQTYRKKKHSSWMVVGSKFSNNPFVRELDHDPYRKGLPGALAKIWKPVRRFEPEQTNLRTLHRWMLLLADRQRMNHRWMGVEDFEFPATAHLFDLIPTKPDILHLHNLHGDYFDLRELGNLSHRVPVVITMHDAWLLSGHCAHSFNCERWITGCGDCPDLRIPPPIRKDASRDNWQRKREIFANSRLYIAAPSEWLMQKIEQSMLMPAIVDKKIISNGVDLSIFHPGDKAQARASLGIPDDMKVILIAGNHIRRDIFKDYPTLQSSLTILAGQHQGRQILMINLGEDGTSESSDSIQIRSVGYQHDPRVVARYYQASDLVIHPARADTFPTTILEAMACGTPVIATAVGGVPEQIEDGITGFLVPTANAQAMAARTGQLLNNEDLCHQMGKIAAETAFRRFDIQRQAQCYLDWYKEIIIREKNNPLITN